MRAKSEQHVRMMRRRLLGSAWDTQLSSCWSIMFHFMPDRMMVTFSWAVHEAMLDRMSPEDTL